jgi:hypothetical protein
MELVTFTMPWEFSVIQMMKDEGGVNQTHSLSITIMNQVHFIIINFPKSHDSPPK